MTACLLFTGFEPFGGEALNASWEAVWPLDGRSVGAARIAASCLPCTFDGCVPALLALIDALQPVAVVCVGQAGGRAALSIERLAVNLDDAGGRPDNAGAVPAGRAIAPEGLAAYFSTLPLAALLRSLAARGIPAQDSTSAGTYVCNHVFYGLMAVAELRPAIGHAGFVHVPYLAEQAARHPGAPGMALQTMCDGLQTIARALARAATGD